MNITGQFIEFLDTRNPQAKQSNTIRSYSVVAGKHEVNGYDLTENIKFCNSYADLPSALQSYYAMQGYQFRRIEIN